MSQVSSKTMDQDTIKKIELILNQKEQSLIPLNLKISKEITITHINDTNNKIISKLKKLPDISIDLIQPEPVFKVPEPPKLKTKNTKNNITPSNVLKDKRAIHNSILKSNMNLNSSETLKQKSNQIFNKTSLITKTSDKRISKNSEASNKIYSISEKENIQRTSSPKILSKKIQSSQMIKSKSLQTKKPVEETSNNSKIFTTEVKPVEKVSKEIIKIPHNAIVTELKTNKLANENYMLMDLSSNGEFNIVPASFILDFNNDSDPEYKQFLMGINKSHLNSNMDMESYQNDTEKELSIIIEEPDMFSDFIRCINTSININNEFNDIDLELESQSSYSRNSSLGITFEQLHISNEKEENIMEQIEDKQNFHFYNHTSKQPSRRHNDMNQTTDIFIKQKDNQLFRKMTSYFCNNLIENIPEVENKLIDFNIQQKQPNSIKDSTYLKSDENQNIYKRKKK
ncbi:uncharacterized protein LOC113549842, partial [Rhopalosiphum maidis]|uniref:uncharacterized protein LOC113549842 n=1 Tax=Rhopalosiphum maidis TaxID=43146 RepID=UPI000EFEC208